MREPRPREGWDLPEVTQQDEAQLSKTLVSQAWVWEPPGVSVSWGLEDGNLASQSWKDGAGWDHQVGPREEHFTLIYQKLAEGTGRPL